MVYLPWVVLVTLVLVWGLPQVKAFLDLLTPQIKVPGLDQLVFRMPPVVASVQAESAVFRLGWLSATGSAILVSTLISGVVFKFTIQEILEEFLGALRQVRFSLLTISTMMAVGFVTRYSGMDATLGLAVAKTGWFYPFFGTLLGWLGVALTGSDTSSNILFGSLQKISAQQLGIDPLIMASANSAGGVMGKMVDAQSIVVASTATRWFGHEGEILRYVFLHSLALAALMGLTVLAQVHLF
jgi:lactate permease